MLISIKLSSQNIEIDFPSCQYLQYYFALKHGTKLDTIAQGRINEDGKATFDIPNKYSTYRGVGNLSIPFCKDQGINLIINSEKRISLKEVNADDVIFLESDENIALLDYLSGRKVTDAKSLYASRIYDILTCLTTKTRLEQEEFISKKLDFKDLYTSGFWQLMLETYYQAFSTDDTLLLNTTQLILDKTEDIIVRRELTQSLILLFSRYGKDNLLMELGSEYLTIPINGKPAPELVTDGMPIQPKSCLIFFYDSDCGLCHYEMRQLIDKYEFLNNDHNQIEVVSVAADTDKNVSEQTASKMPWKNKLCDLKGFNGENFENYGIVGTPTLILVDKEGIVRGRYMRLSEFLKY